MPRRNNRAGDHYEPLDLTPPQVDYRTLTREQREAAEQARIKRQTNARINGGIDWGICLVPGCGRNLHYFNRPVPKAHRDHELDLPLCPFHLSVAYMQAAKITDPLFVEANTRYLERRDEKAAQRRDADKQQKLARTDGHIYFVRLNGLIKVGWSRDVHERLRAYGPDVTVLCLYPGTRDDETNLHRQFRPVLQRGREWYQDCAILTDYATKMVEQHGAPEVYDWWTRPKEVIRTRKRGR